MPTIQKSLFGRQLGFDDAGRLLVGIPGVDGALPVEMVLGTATAASTAISNTTTETLFSQTVTIPASSLRSGSLVQMRWQGIATSTNGTDTLTIKAYLGGLSGTLLFTHAATDVANDNVFQGEYELIFRTVGSSGTVVGCGWGKSVTAAEATATFKDDILASTAVDTTASLVLGISAQWSVASASNSCRLDFLRATLG